MKIKRDLFKLIIVFAVAAICFFTVVTFAACNKDVTESDTLIVGTSMDIKSLNRLASAGGDHGYNYTMLSHTLAQMPVVYKTEGRYQSQLCDIDVSEDGRVYGFQLRDGFLWHDGQNVTAEDLLFTFQKNAIGADVRLNGERADIALEKANPSFLDNLVNVTLMPKHLLDGKTATTVTDGESVIGCGPFKFKERNIASGTIVFEKFNGYPYADSVFFDRVIFRIFESDDTMRLALKAGEIDMIWNYGGGLNADSVSDFKNANNIKLVSYAVKAVPKTLFFNNAKVTDVRVKKAIRCAIDYEKIRRIFGTSEATLPRAGFVAPNVPGYCETEILLRDLNEAKRLLADAGYSEANKFEFDLLVRADSNDTQYADLLKTDLEETGLISVRFTKISGAAQWRAYYQAGNHMASLAAITEAGYDFDAGYATRYLLPTDNYAMPRESFPAGNPVSHGNIDIGAIGSLTEFGAIRQALADAKNVEELNFAARDYQNYISENVPCIALLYDGKTQAMSNRINGETVDGTFGTLSIAAFMTLKKQ